MRRLSLLPLFIVIALITACQPKNDDFVTIQGTVQDYATGSAIEGAAVIITSPTELTGTFTSTDSSGTFIFESLDISEPTSLSLQVSINGYDAQTKNVTVLPSQVVVLDFNLVEEGTTDDTGNNDGTDDSGNEVVAGDPGVPSAIVLRSVSSSEINIRQTGGTVNATFSFEVQDSSGRSMDSETPVEVNFRILNGPDGGEAVVPQKAQTNADGVVVTSLFSGDSAGVVRIEAFLDREDGERISSSPIIISISGGFPHPDHFFVAPEYRNIEGFNYISEDLVYNVVASVGDKFGNPVREGTIVDFRSLQAGIVRGSAQTNANGFASVSFFANGAAPNSHPLGTGFFTIRAHTYDENNDDLETDVLALLTTRDAIIEFENNTFDVPSNGSDVVNFTVTDLNGHPMAAGTSITVESGEAIGLAGDSFVRLGDYFYGGPGITEFAVTLSDVDDEDSSTVPTTVTVTVTTPSGYQTSATMTGTRAKIRGN